MTPFVSINESNKNRRVKIYTFFYPFFLNVFCMVCFPSKLKGNHCLFCHFLSKLLRFLCSLMTCFFFSVILYNYSRQPVVRKFVPVISFFCCCSKQLPPCGCKLLPSRRRPYGYIFLPARGLISDNSCETVSHTVLCGQFIV